MTGGPTQRANRAKRRALREEAGDVGQYAGTRNPEGGFLVNALPWSGPIERGPDGKIENRGSPDEDETVRAIRRVAGIIGDAELGDECIADLPAEDLSGEVQP